MEKGVKDHEDGFSRSWSDLPQNFIASLLYYLSPKSRCAFKATCRSWNEAKLFLPVPVGSPSSPCHSSPILVRTKTSYQNIECYHPMTNEFFRLSINEEHGIDLKLCCSNLGWLLMSEQDRWDRDCYWEPSVFFLNPFTKIKIDHGRRRDNSSYSSTFMCFASAPTSSDCPAISAISMGLGLTMTIDGSSTTTRIPDEVWKHKLPRRSISHVFHRGSFYFLVGAGVVGTFSESSSLGVDYAFHYTKLFECGTKLRHSFLIEVDGKKLGIFDHHQGIRVLWLDTERWEWNPVGDEDLRDKILYISYKGSFVQCDATTKDVGNKIYFPTIIDGGGVYYSLDTKKYHTSSCELEDIEDYGDSMAWITPTITDI